MNKQNKWTDKNNKIYSKFVEKYHCYQMDIGVGITSAKISFMVVGWHFYFSVDCSETSKNYRCIKPL